jgi:hypothetical protein
VWADTANLASFFTKPTHTMHGPSNLSQARRSTACVQHLFFERARTSQFFNRTDGLPETSTNPFTFANGFTIDPGIFAAGEAYCLNALQDRRADLFVGDVNYIHALNLNHCVSTRSLQPLHGQQLHIDCSPW